VSMSTEEIEALPAAVPIKQVSEALGISLDLTYAAANNGELPVIKLGRRMLVPKTALLKMLGMEPAGEPSDAAVSAP
jgi:excisionase family DNA binding protein